MDLYKLYQLCQEWFEKRSSLNGPEKRHFERWIVRTHPEIVRECQNQPALLRQQCRAARAMVSPPKKHGLGLGILQKYSEKLAAIYTSLPAEKQTGFKIFLEQILNSYQTERGLKRFLQQNFPDS